MAQRGRKSAGDLAAVSSIPERPKPPRELTRDQNKVWLRVVSALPIDWFGSETHDTLKQFCVHVVDAEKIRKWIDDLDAEATYKDFDNLLKMQERESRAMNALARSMRMTQQSTYIPHKSRKLDAVKKTWKTL